AMLFWLPLYYGQLETFSAFAPVDWHIHELLFGYLSAVVTGFLLTAIPNWTGRLPVQDLRLLVLVLLWIAGRIAVSFSAELGWLPGAVIDCSFLLAVVAAAATEIVAGRNWRNLKVLLP
ncbi:MAG: NnrS family protein, partial [Mesorhizobium sp.]